MKSQFAKYFGDGGTAASVAWLASLSVSIALYFWLLHLRSGVFDPFGLPIFWYLVAFQDYWAALLMVPVLLISLHPALQRASGAVACEIGRIPFACATLVALLLAIGAIHIYHAYPLSMDEYAAWFQSRVFAAWRLTGQVPPQLVDWVVPDRFQGRFLNVSHATGQVASAYWPGFALLLAPFTALGVPWLANPLLAAGIVLTVGSLVTRLGGNRDAAGLAILLTIASQAYSVNGISFYSMNAHLLVNLLFAGLLFEPTPRRALLAGLIGSVGLVLHNPVPHVLFAIPWIAWLLLDARRRFAIAALIAGYLPLCVLLGLGWPVLGARLFGVQDGAGGHAGFVAAWIARMSGVIRPPDYIILLARLAGLAKVWLWAVPGLPLLAAIGFWRRRKDVRVVLLTASALLTIVGFLCVPFDQGHGWGFRYFQSAWGVLPILGAIALLPHDLPSARDEGLVDGWRLVAAVAVAWMIVGTCLRAVQVETFIARHLGQLPGPVAGAPPVQIINPIGGYYLRDLVQNDPFLRGPVILVSRGRRQDAEMMSERFPGLEVTWSQGRGQVWDARR